MSLATPPMALPPGMANATPAQIAKFQRTMLFLQAARTCEMAVEEVTKPRDTLPSSWVGREEEESSSV